MIIDARHSTTISSGRSRTLSVLEASMENQLPKALATDSKNLHEVAGSPVCQRRDLCDLFMRQLMSSATTLQTAFQARFA